MSLGDPFDTTYAGAFKAGSSLGEGLNNAAGNFADVMKQKQAYNTLKAAGMITKKVTPPSEDELKKGLEDYAKQNGVHQVNWMESDDPKETRAGLEGAYKSLGIPLPKGKTSIDYNLAPGTEYKVNDNLTMKNPKTMLSSFGLGSLDSLDSYNKALNEHGLEVTGVDQKGQPIIRKVQENVPAEKFKAEQADKKKAQDEKSQIVLDSAKDSLKTIDEVEKGINHFGVFGNVPSIPGGERKNWEVNVNKLTSQKIIDVMREMKEASKTGSTGFGQLSNKELTVLQNASTALKKDLSPTDAQRYIDQMKETLQKVVDNKSGGNVSQETSTWDASKQSRLDELKAKLGK